LTPLNHRQHAATLAGMASATSGWLVTIGKDGRKAKDLIPKHEPPLGARDPAAD